MNINKLLNILIRKFNNNYLRIFISWLLKTVLLNKKRCKFLLSYFYFNLFLNSFLLIVFVFLKNIYKNPV